jgi:hypothetical protein
MKLRALFLLLFMVPIASRGIKRSQILTCLILTAVAGTTFILSGCAAHTTIQPVTTSKSEFDSAIIYTGSEATVSDNKEGVEEFRVFHQGATGFVTPGAVRYDAEQRAIEFCDRKGQAMKVFRERTSTPPHVLGNYPRIELIFGCVEKPVAAPVQDVKYEKLVNLKKLLDSGVLTQEEFTREKAKILSQP